MERSQRDVERERERKKGREKWREAEREREGERGKIQLLPRGKVHRPAGTAKCRQGVDSSSVTMVTVAPGVARRSVTKRPGSPSFP